MDELERQVKEILANHKQGHVCDELLSKVTGSIETISEYDKQGSVLNIYPKWVGGDIIAVSKEIVETAYPKFLFKVGKEIVFTPYRVKIIEECEWAYLCRRIPSPYPQVDGSIVIEATLSSSGGSLSVKASKVGGNIIGVQDALLKQFSDYAFFDFDSDYAFIVILNHRLNIIEYSAKDSMYLTKYGGTIE